MENKNWIGEFKNWDEAETYFIEEVFKKTMVEGTVGFKTAFETWIKQNYPDNFHVKAQSVADQKEMEDYKNVHQS